MTGPLDVDPALSFEDKLTGEKVFMAPIIADATGLNRGIVGTILSELDGSFHGITLS